MGPLAILFNNLGPYHAARLEAAARLGPVHAVETVGRDRTYAWSAVTLSAAVGRTTLITEPDILGGSAGPTGGLVRTSMWQALHRLQPSAVAIPGWSDPAALAALAWCVRTGTPTVLLSASQVSDEPRRWWREWLKRRIVALAGAGMGGGSPQIAYLVQLGMDPDQVVGGYDVVDNAHFAHGAAQARANAAAVRQRLGLPARYLLCSCRFVPKKNLIRLLSAFAAYRAGTPTVDWHLVLLGDGPMRPALSEQIARSGLATVVHLPGFIGYAEMPTYLGLCDACILPSTAEQWGLVVNEAMAAGCPVLVSQACGCVQDLVQPGINGLTFDPLDLASIQRALTDLALQPESLPAMGRASVRIIAAHTPAVFATNLWDAVARARARGPVRADPLQQWLLHQLIHRPGASG